jgi:FtsP/CotA-like multicopper oxidase with cupredoxin domain
MRGRASAPCCAILLVAWLGACNQGPEGPPPGQPPGWADEVALTRPTDLDPDPHVLEIQLTAKPATIAFWDLTPPTEVYTFDGGVPGPLLELTAGDRLLVHFKNELPVPTTIHWHGLRIPAAMDGVPGHSQPEVAPGASFDYEFVVPDAGLFWYHPHVDSSAQVGAGLYGPLLVRPADDSEDEAPADEVVLVLSDIGIGDDGTLNDPHSGGDLGTLFGHEGNVALVNGRWLPTLHVRSGATQRWRIVNAARSRYFQLELPGVRFSRIGGDGGLLERPVEEERLLLTPGQRVDVLVTPTAALGSPQFLTWIPYDRGFGSTEFRPSELLLRLDFADGGSGEPATPSFARAIAPIDVAGATPVDIALTQTKDADGAVVLGINGVPFADLPPFPATIGETQVWTIRNEMDWSHPFHLHGFFFQALGDDGAPERPLAWRDTVDVPFKSSRTIAVRFDERPGMWMFHCHILDHADAGMMGMVELVE